MTDPRNLRLLVGEIRSALDGYQRQDLVEVLTYVFKEYVVEGASVLPSGSGAALDARTELEGMSFAQVITWLQRHLDLPELGQFEVEGTRVSLRSGGRAVPVEAPRAEPVALPPARVAVAAAPVAAAPAPTVAAPQHASAPLAPTTTPAPAPAAQPAREEPTDSDSRFSRLEVD